ncbi:MAG: [protein-PII] uridylyltransferase [Ferrovum sp.]|nr:[protein-PII] uridylyltransferase [Ferrovum sp.]
MILNSEEAKFTLKNIRSSLEERYLENADPKKFFQEWTKSVDTILAQIWSNYPDLESFALVAVGGYGREEFYPYSDIDLLLLSPEKNSSNHPPAKTETLESLIAVLWNLGITFGHSIRTVSECVEEGLNDHTIATALCEARFLVGNKSLYVHLQHQLPKLQGPNFLEQKYLEQKKRHLKHHFTAYNLEPNIKEAPGGLRDLHIFNWIHWGMGKSKHWTSLKTLLTPYEIRTAKKRLLFLQDLRIRLHFLAGRAEDRLLFDFQNDLANSYTIHKTKNRLASELFMQRYYKNAKGVLLLNQLVLSEWRVRWEEPIKRPSLKLSKDYIQQGELLETYPNNLFETHPHKIFEGILTLQQHPELKNWTPSTLRSLWRGRLSITQEFRSDPRNQINFLNILKHPNRTTEMLRMLNNLDILGRYIPKFGRIVGQMQHDLFHAYTVDEHILRVLRNLRRYSLPQFEHEFPNCSKLMKEFPRPELLYLSAIFHDIAKGRGGHHSELGAIDVLEFGQHHQMPSEDIEFVQWIVVHHLTMSSIAQKQDLTNPQVILDFSKIIPSPYHLTGLYLFTTADIRATSPQVWNAWKGKLLWQLYQACLTTQSPDSPLEKKQHLISTLTHYGLTETLLDPFWNQVDNSYFERHEINTLVWHARQLYGRVNDLSPIIRGRLSPVGEGYQWLIYTPDQIGLFARICHWFDAHGFDIVEARIHTTNNQKALDTFQVISRHTETEHYQKLIKNLSNDLTLELTQQKPLGKPKSQLPRRLRYSQFIPKVTWDPIHLNHEKQITITTGDRPGILYLFASFFQEHQITLKAARIHTMGERIEDTFVISGPLLDSPDSLKNLQTELLQLCSPPEA